MALNYREKYFRWLVKFVSDWKRFKPMGYSNLLRFLHKLRYYPYWSDDIARASDGLYMRERFIQECELDPEVLNILCLRDFEKDPSFLEFLCGIPARFNQTLTPNGWILYSFLQNLELNQMNNAWWYELYARDDTAPKRMIINSVERYINCEYEPDGIGDIFICPGMGDQREASVKDKWEYFAQNTLSSEV